MKKYKIDLQKFAVDEKMIKTADLAKVRDIDFVYRFGYSLTKLTEALGITRVIRKQSGSVLKAYKVSGTLESGTVAEGEVIPLSKYKTSYEPIGEVILKKWRKQTTIEAISDKGYDQAVSDTSEKMLQDIQKSIRADFFTFLSTGSTAVTGANLQATLAQTWGKLQVLFDDDAVDTVFFINPLDVADYLSTAQITTQTVFGMTYIKNFLGLGDVFLNSNVTQGKVYATAKENVVLYYIDVDDSDISEVFSFTKDETGYIGIHTQAAYDNLTAEIIAASGVGLFAENLGGIVVGTISKE